MVCQLKEISFYSEDHPKPTLYTNSNSTATIASNSVAHQRTKHIKIDIHTIHDGLIQKKLKLDIVDTRLNVVDIFTKSVVGDIFRNLMKHLGMIGIHKVNNQKTWKANTE